MNRYFSLFFSLLLTGFLIRAAAQVPLGAWRDHLPYNKSSRLAEYRHKVFSATDDGSLFSYSTDDNSITKYSKINGLSDAGISTIAATPDQNVLLIGYANGNLDLIRNDSIINIPDIKQKLITGDKTIQNILFIGHYAYLASGFGIVVCDVDRMEIRDSYLFGPGGSQIRVNDIASDGNQLFAATDQGIYLADLESPNLVDYNAWVKLSNLPDPESSYDCLGLLNGKLFTVYSNPLSGFDDIIVVDEMGWEVWEHSYPDRFSYVGVQHGYLILCSLLATKVYDGQEQFVREAVTYYARHALYDSRENLWYADPESGLVRLDAAGNGSVIAPDGPAYKDVGDIKIRSGRLWAAGGTEASKWAGHGAYSFVNEHWENYNKKTEPALEDFLNISEIAIDPGDPEHVIGGSYGYGLVEFRNGTLVDIIDENDGVLQPVSGYGHGYVLVKGVDFEQDGTLWVVLTLADQPVYRRSQEGTWQIMELDYGGFGIDTRINGILASSAGTKWLLIERNGLLVFEEQDGSITKERFFTVQNQAGHLLDRVFCIAEDREGDIWVGTNKGPVVFYKNYRLFEEETLTGYQPEIPRNDGTPYVDFLLATEKINSIAVDGANRKWLATEKSGVYLVSADGKTVIHHFHTENSPLLSDNVQGVAVNDKTGEVFFGTDKGIISFRGNATEGNEDFAHVYVFPNPVRETYRGDIVITGLVSDVLVKITDISGNLVFETESLGGQAVWDGNNFRGERVGTGVYLVFCSTADGMLTHVTKLLLIH